MRMGIEKELRNTLATKGIVFALSVAFAFFFWRFILQLLLALIVLVIISFILYKGFSYLFRFIVFTLRVGYKTAGVVVAISLIGWILFIFL